MSILPIPPQEAAKKALAGISGRRMRDVLEKRYGLKGGKKRTLEAIGTEYKITRERVRQIEAEALRHIRKPDIIGGVEPLLAAMKEHIHRHGDVMSERHLFDTLGSPNIHPHLAFFLDVGNSFHFLPETDSFHARWTTDKGTSQNVEKAISGVLEELDEKRVSVPLKELDAMIASHGERSLGHMPEEPARQAYLATSKLIRQNPYGEYGIVGWPHISPSGVKDKAYVALEKAKKPLHFREVAEEINKAGWTNKKAHPQTVHNELIKDPRFVLVGRGLYALKEWGYEPGPVRDVVMSVLKAASRPLSKDEIIQAVLKRRLVKPPTVLLNLQNADFFKRMEDGRYTLV